MHNLILNNIIKNVFDTFNDIKSNVFDLIEFKSFLKNTLETFYPELLEYYNENNVLIEDNKIIYNYFNSINFLTCEERDEYYNNNRNNINLNELSELQINLYNQYEYLIKLPQPAQKSKEWFEMRNNMITASNCGTVIGECKHSTIKKFLLEKIGMGSPFKENEYVYHGKKYEKIATMIYEEIYNSKIGEFGLIKHPTINHLGASPDGISMSLTLDGKNNKLIGRMLEIKCPPRRKICNIGKIKGDIIPNYYYIQCQIQLFCCDLNECDFWQCHIIEYKTENEFIYDNILDDIHSENQIYDQNEESVIENEPIKIKINDKLRKGIIIELLPKDKSKIPNDEQEIWYAKYIYPNTLIKTPLEYINWSKNMIKNLDKYYPDLTKDYYYSRCVYWKLILSHNELVVRQDIWFEKNKEKYKLFWDRVLYYREHKNEVKEDIIDQYMTNQYLLTLKTDKIPKKKEGIKSKKISNKEDDPFLSD